MGTNALTKACHQCGQVTPHTQQTPNHVLHLILSILTAGIWIIVWLFVALTGTGKAVCQNCQLRGMQGGR